MTKPPARNKKANGSNGVAALITATPTSNAKMRPADDLVSAADARALFHKRTGQLLLALTRLSRYRDVPVGDLKSLFLTPLTNDRIAFAQTDSDHDDAMPVGMAIWASVSEAVSTRIAGEANAGKFPIHLEPDDWTSGEIVWLLDLLVPDKKAGTTVFMNFGQLIEGRSFRAHPVVWSMVDRSITDKIADLTRSADPKATAN